MTKALGPVGVATACAMVVALVHCQLDKLATCGAAPSVHTSQVSCFGCPPNRLAQGQHALWRLTQSPGRNQARIFSPHNAHHNCSCCHSAHFKALKVPTPTPFRPKTKDPARYPCPSTSWIRHHSSVSLPAAKTNATQNKTARDRFLRSTSRGAATSKRS